MAVSTASGSSPGQRLRVLRDVAGLSDQQLADAARVAHNTVRAIERDAVTPRPRVRHALAAALAEALDARIRVDTSWNVTAVLESIWTPGRESMHPLVVARERRGMSAREAAGAIGVAPSTLLRIEAGEPAQPATLKRVADYFGVPLDAAAR